MTEPMLVAAEIMAEARACANLARYAWTLPVAEQSEILRMIYRRLGTTLCLDDPLVESLRMQEAPPKRG